MFKKLRFIVIFVVGMVSFIDVQAKSLEQAFGAFTKASKNLTKNLTKKTPPPIPTTLKTNFTVGNTLISVVEGQITQQRVDAIVNAANVTLIGSAGVALVIQDAAGPQLVQYIKDNILPDKNGIRRPVGKACYTPPFNLKMKSGIKGIIHAVGPDARDPEQEAKKEILIEDAYRNSLTIAREYNLRTIAFPAISSNIFGYPLAQSAPIVIDKVLAIIGLYPKDYTEIRFMFYNDPAGANLYSRLLTEELG